MDDGGENISWVGNIFLKLENLCTEVDGAVRQEIRNVENHFQIMGANVANFCWDMVLDNPPQTSDDIVEEAADNNIDVLVSDASNMCIDEDHHEEDTRKEAAYDIDVLESDSSDMDTVEDHSEEDKEVATDYDTDVLASDASDIDTDEKDSEEGTEEDTDSDVEILVSDALDIDTDEDYCEDSEEDTEEEALYEIDILASDLPKVGIEEDHKKVLLDFHNRFCSASVEPTDGVQSDSSLEQNIDSGVYEIPKFILDENLIKDTSDTVVAKEEDSIIFPEANTYNLSALLSYNFVNSIESCKSQGLYIEVTPSNASKESPVADDSTAASILDNDVTKLEKETIESFQEMKLDENCIRIDTAQFEEKGEERLMKDIKAAIVSGRHQEEQSKMKRINLFGVILDTLKEDEFCDSDWVIV